jgi:hypothetical protein
MFYLLKHINNLLRSQVHYIKEHVFVNGLHSSYLGVSVLRNLFICVVNHACTLIVRF